MRVNKKYLVSVALLAVLAVGFGLVGTIAPLQESSSSSSDSVGHFQNPPTYDSGWVDIRGKCGQYFSLKHNLNTTDVVVDITGKQSLDPEMNLEHQRNLGGTGVNVGWSRTYGGARGDYAWSVVQTGDGGYALAGHTYSFGAGDCDFWLVKTDVEMGLARTGLTNNTITLHRGKTDPYWNYVRVRIWLIKEPSWIYGDINMDGTVDVKDLYILSRNYGKTFSLLSLSGIIAIAGIHTYKTKRKQPKQPKQPSYIS
ncbi:MAG: hypothetical protein AOA66_1203 [Candidatus Bathyarchaeota archaeon BA2]|nr:MAG: hypothetical protein AOA66_1203 [Candidatus Bathyarchaeota archaeon BA2]